ncbi:MAG: 30S ribosomal protein THX [Bacteroidales bacterium]|nr:30S ribosomal protein THX [Bacteroidales bacterium]
MGKGDKKSKRGKIIRGSFGVRRPRKTSKKAVAAAPEEVKKEVEKVAAEAAKVPEATKPARTAKTTKPKAPAKTTAKSAAKKTEKEEKSTRTKATKPAPKTKKPAAKKEKE